MLIDLHAHSSGISKCCRIPIDEVIKTAIENHIDGIVLTNHYQKSYVTDGDSAAFVRSYLDEYYYAKQCAERLNYNLYFGIEVTMEKYPGVHLLIYGVDESFLERHPTVYDNTQEELYRTVKENGGILIQAHPYRQNVDRMLDPAFLDGIEISCHPLYEDTHLEKLSSVAKRQGLILTCGGDYHADTHRPHCGVYMPDGIEGGRDIADYLSAAKRIELCVQEVDEAVWQDVTYMRDIKHE